MSDDPRGVLHASGRGGVRNGTMYDTVTSTEYGVTGDGRITRLTEDPDAQALRWEQRPWRWAEEARIIAHAGLSNGKLDPGEVTAQLADMTTRGANFPLSGDWVRGLSDQGLGWHLCDLLGGMDFMRSLTPDAQQERAEVNQKKSNSPSAHRPSRRATPKRTASSSRNSS